ncbi:MAG: YdcF family protein [Bacteroidales bacterium]|nr:YdcF family protein [Bacteroidales bacterium]
MFFALSKFLGVFLSPLVWVLILATLALRKKSRKLYIILSILVLYLFSNGFLVTEAYRAWESPMVKLRKGVVFDACIVPGGWMVTHSTDYDRMIFRNSTDRLLQAVLLYKQGVCRKIVLSGGSGSLTDPGYEESSYLQRYLVGIGIPEKDILVESTSRNTHENAVNCLQLLGSESPQKRYLLVTSADHMPRAYKSFRQVGLNVTPYPVEKWAGDRRYYYGAVFFPKPDNLMRWNSLIHEITGYWIYYLRGWI